MNKSELVEALAIKSNLPVFTAGRALDILVNEIVTEVTKGRKVTIAGFGTFKPAERAARDGLNPKTGEKIRIPASTVPRFSPGAVFKDLVANKDGSRK